MPLTVIVGKAQETPGITHISGLGKTDPKQNESLVLSSPPWLPCNISFPLQNCTHEPPVLFVISCQGRSVCVYVCVCVLKYNYMQ